MKANIEEQKNGLYKVTNLEKSVYAFGEKVIINYAAYNYDPVNVKGDLAIDGYLAGRFYKTEAGSYVYVGTYALGGKEFGTFEKLLVFATYGTEAN